MSEMLEKTLKLFQLRLFVFALYAINEKSEMSERRFCLFNSMDVDIKMPFF